MRDENKERIAHTLNEGVLPCDSAVALQQVLAEKDRVFCGLCWIYWERVVHC